MTDPNLISKPTRDGVFEAALFEDGTALVSILSRDGIVLRANHRMIEFAGGESKLLGRSISDLCAPGSAAERLELIRRAIDTSTPRRLTGMVHGCWHVTTYRPFTDPVTGEAQCLSVCQPVFPEVARKVHGRDDAPPLTIARHHDLGPLARLTERELELLALIGDGLPTAEIAQRLHRSAKTIEWHRNSLGAKLGVRNRVELALIALRAGICGLSAEQLAALRPAPHAEPVMVVAPVTNNDPAVNAPIAALAHTSAARRNKPDEA